IVADDAADDLEVVEEVLAGAEPTRRVEPGTAIRIMTGAPLPQGADAVIPVEQTEMIAASRVRLLHRPPAGKHIMRRGSAMRSGQQVLAAGQIVRPLEVALLAEVGAARLQVLPPPRVAVLATGSELVPCNQVPAGGQIRNTNGPALAA